MTDTGDAERPLTRRELRARERAAAAAALGDGAPEPAESAEAPSAASVPSAPVASAPSAPEPSAPSAPEPEPEPVASGPADEIEADSVPAAAEEPAPKPEQPDADADADAVAEVPTQAMSLEELAAEAEADASPAEAEPQAEQAVPAPKGLGRFFGRKAPEEAPAEEPVAFDELLDGIAEEPQALAADTPEVEGPARARGLRIDESRRQHLDDVRDEDVDRLEIDEVEQAETRRVSAAEVSGKTPAQLEDTRGESFEADDEQTSGPSRGRGSRLPFVVNVVEDTSEHHISDLRKGRGESPTSSTSSITANALVLPATGQEDEIQFESEDGVLVTGSIDLPDGYASSGRARGKFDSSDIDSTADGSEVANPETAPVRASRAVSSYANARVSIAPKRQSRSALPWALGIGGGVVFAGVLVVVIGYTAGWF